MERSVRCECIGGEHYLNFYFIEEDKQLYVDMMAKTKFPFWRNLREAWNILRGKDACYDGILLNKDKSLEISNFLQEIWKEKQQ